MAGPGFGGRRDGWRRPRPRSGFAAPLRRDRFSTGSEGRGAAQIRPLTCLYGPLSVRRGSLVSAVGPGAGKEPRAALAPALGQTGGSSPESRPERPWGRTRQKERGRLSYLKE